MISTAEVIKAISINYLLFILGTSDIWWWLNCTWWRDGKESQFVSTPRKVTWTSLTRWLYGKLCWHFLPRTFLSIIKLSTKFSRIACVSHTNTEHAINYRYHKLMISFFLDIFLFALFMMHWVFNYQVLLPFTAKIIGIQIVPAEGLKVMK